MENALGTCLRELRAAQRLSLRGLAAKSGVGKATLVRWETAATRPRVPELEAALNALSASDAERRRALTLLDAPRAVARLSRETDARAAALCNVTGPAPNGGDLLRALRHRKGWTMERAAQAIGVQRTTLGRWEAAVTWPSTEQMQTLCYLLDAHEEEWLALTTGRFSLASPAMQTLSLEETQRRLHATVRADFDPQEFPLTELRYLSLEAAVWPRAAQREAAQVLLAEIYAHHAHHLTALHRLGEADPYANRALELTHDRRQSPLSISLRAAAVTARAEAASRPAGRAGAIETLLRWLPRTEGVEDYRPWFTHLIADFLLQAGRTESALEFNARYARLPHPQGMLCAEQRLSRLEIAHILTGAGRPREALEWLPTQMSVNPLHRAQETLSWAETLLAAGQAAEAHDRLHRAQADVAAFSLAPLRARADALARRFL